MLRFACLAALGFGMVVQAAPVAAQTPSPPPSPAAADHEATDLGDVVISGDRLRRLERLSEQFVNEVAAPVGGRSLARWMSPVCVGVVNFQPEAGRQIADRVATVAGDLGVPIQDKACAPNIFIVGTTDGPGLASRWVAESRRDFALNVSDSHVPLGALHDFETSDAPVRWWQVSLPMRVDMANNVVMPAVRINNRMARTYIFSTSQLRAQTRDDFFRVMVVVDVEKLGGVSLEQLCDYLVMVSFAQVDARADTSPYDTILNLFESPGMVAGLTDWDRAYLGALYGATGDERLNRRTQAAGLVTRVREGGADDPQ